LRYQSSNVEMAEVVGGTFLEALHGIGQGDREGCAGRRQVGEYELTDWTGSVDVRGSTADRPLERALAENWRQRSDQLICA